MGAHARAAHGGGDAFRARCGGALSEPFAQHPGPGAGHGAGGRHLVAGAGQRAAAQAPGGGL